jgi:hypothetical protein
MAPRTARNLRVLARIESRHGLPAGYFLTKLPRPCRSATFGAAPCLSNTERRRLAWHLPLDFETRPRAEREEYMRVGGSQRLPLEWIFTRGRVELS